MNRFNTSVVNPEHYNETPMEGYKRGYGSPLFHADIIKNIQLKEGVYHSPEKHWLRLGYMIYVSDRNTEANMIITEIIDDFRFKAELTSDVFIKDEIDAIFYYSRKPKKTLEELREEHFKTKNNN